jgi:hypothetical protein
MKGREKDDKSKTLSLETLKNKEKLRPLANFFEKQL